MLEDQTRKIAGVDATKEVMASGYGRVCPRVVHKAGGVVEASCLDGKLSEPTHAVGGVQEPPWGTQPN
jgi:hypothetical protein